MGNKLCCQQQPKKDLDYPITVLYKDQEIKIPDLDPIVADHLAKQKPFYNELPSKPTLKVFGEDVYQGQVDERGRPNGFGKIYYRNGSVFVGEFNAGIANGVGHYVKPDGSYYHGRLQNNKANDENGYYWTPTFSYRGSIVNNQINGKGEQNGVNHHYEGIYKDGQKVQGLLQWKQGQDQYQYQGNFNASGNFEGKGRLTQKNKGQYIGDFLNGEKHGKGEYKFRAGNKYIGEYKHGVKSGKGKIVNSSGVVSYEGQFENDMPHGKGSAYNPKDRQMKQRQWVLGIDKVLLD